MLERPESRFFRSADGLRLHALDFRPERDSGLTPLVCLPGLTRASADFIILGTILSSAPTHPRRVIAFDYRGRGLSDHDPDWRRYTLDVERDDVLRGLDEFGIAHAHWFGTSRGGLHLMAMAEGHANRIDAVILNDIGPVLEMPGLARIKGYIGTRPSPRSFGEAIALLKAGSGKTFQHMDDALWQTFAETTFGEDERDLRLRYDPALAHSLDGFDPKVELPSFWTGFDRLAPRPMLVIRGSHSDLLSDQTAEAMARRWPGIERLEVAGQGHAPIVDAMLAGDVGSFLARKDGLADGGTGGPSQPGG